MLTDISQFIVDFSKLNFIYIKQASRFFFVETNLVIQFPISDVNFVDFYVGFSEFNLKLGDFNVNFSNFDVILSNLTLRLAISVRYRPFLVPISNVNLTYIGFSSENLAISAKLRKI